MKTQQNRSGQKTRSLTWRGNRLLIRRSADASWSQNTISTQSSSGIAACVIDENQQPQDRSGASKRRIADSTPRSPASTLPRSDASTLQLSHADPLAQSGGSSGD